MGWTDSVQLGLNGRGVLRVGAVGLPPKEELLLRSVVRVLDAQTERAWEFVDAPPYDVTFLGDAAASDATGGLAVRVLPPGARDEVDDASITLPIRPLNLRPLLDRLGNRLRTPSPATLAAASTPMPPRVAAFGLPPTAEAFVARVRRSNATPFTIVPAGEPAIAIVDPDAGIWWQPADAAATVPGSLRVPDLATRLLVAGVEYLDLEADSDQAMPGTQGTPQRLEALLWHLGVQATPGEALRPVARRSTFRLTRWPDFGSIGGNDLLALKLAALLVNRPHRLDQVVTASRAPRGAIIDILNACALCDLLAAETPMASTLTPSSSSSPTAPPAASRYGLVLHALRSALGIGRS